MKRLCVLIGMLFLAVLLTGITYAQQSVGDDEVNAVAKKLYCPVCENTPLDVCPTQVCKDWRELIRAQLSEGWTEEQILDYFEANYGSRVLAQPPARGFTVLVWILPLAGLAGGGAFLWRLLRRGQERRGATASLGGQVERAGVPPKTAVSAVESSEADKHPAEEPVAAGEATGPPGVSAEMLARIEREVEERF